MVLTVPMQMSIKLAVGEQCTSTVLWTQDPSVDQEQTVNSSKRFSLGTLVEADCRYRLEAGYISQCVQTILGSFQRFIVMS